MAEIKPLEHWRRMDEVAAKALAECFRLIALGPKEVPVVRPARAPFPARALRDCPWDISALVGE